MPEHDEIGEANQELGRMFRVGLQAASRLAEQFARAREQSLRDAQARSEQAARELRERLVAEQSAAEAGLRPILTDQWWKDASHGQIADSWQQAQGWKEHSQFAAEVADRIHKEVRDRYGIDAADPGVDPRTIEKVLRDAEQTTNAGNNEQQRANRDDRTASELMAHADRLDAAGRGRSRSGETAFELRLATPKEKARSSEVLEQPGHFDQAKEWAWANDPEWMAKWDLAYSNADTQDAKQMDRLELLRKWNDTNLDQDVAAPAEARENDAQADVATDTAHAAYDSAQRRNALASGMTAAGVDKETVGARLSADLDQAKHPRGAVLNGNGKAPVARKGSPKKGRSQEREHTGR